jgi:hypothetical protein
MLHDAADQPRIVSGWLAGPPSLAGEGPLHVALLDDLLSLLRAYRIRSVHTSEPRYYRPGPKGRVRLTEALLAGRAESLYLSAALPAGAAGSAGASIRLRFEDRPDFAVDVGARILAGGGGAQVPALARDVAEFVVRWFAPLRAAAAFVSDRLNADPGRTEHELEGLRPSLMRWSALIRYARGAFWGTGLGPELCAHLGGREQVLREAPVAIKRALGEGVWLQVSEAPPAEPQALDRLTEYLAPCCNGPAPTSSGSARRSCCRRKSCNRCPGRPRRAASRPRG